MRLKMRIPFKPYHDMRVDHNEAGRDEDGYWFVQNGWAFNEGGDNYDYFLYYEY